MQSACFPADLEKYIYIIIRNPCFTYADDFNMVKDDVCKEAVNGLLVQRNLSLNLVSSKYLSTGVGQVNNRRKGCALELKAFRTIVMNEI